MLLQLTQAILRLLDRAQQDLESAERLRRGQTCNSPCLFLLVSSHLQLPLLPILLRCTLLTCARPCRQVVDVATRPNGGRREITSRTLIGQAMKNEEGEGQAVDPTRSLLHFLHSTAPYKH
jgi:hypothetical protein